MRGLLALTALLGLSAPAFAGTSSPKVVLDLWDAAFMKGNRCGYVHTFTEEVEKDGQKLLRTTVEMRLRLKRFNDLVELAMDNGTWETPEGKVTGTFMRQYLGKVKKVDITGTVVGDQLKLELTGVKELVPAPWTEGVLG